MTMVVGTTVLFIPFVEDCRSLARNIVPNLGLDIQALRQKHKVGISKYLKFFKIHKNKEFPVNFFLSRQGQSQQKLELGTSRGQLSPSDWIFLSSWEGLTPVKSGK